IAIFIVVGLIFAGFYGNPTFYSAVTHSFPARSWTDPVTKQIITNAVSSYYTYSPYFLVSLVTFMWPVLLIFYMLTYLTASRRERIIERAMERELDLEKMRLQVELAQAQNDMGIDTHEKLKRTVSLSDDGELVFDEDSSAQSNSSVPERKARNREA